MAVVKPFDSMLSSDGDDALTAQMTWKLVSLGSGVLAGVAARRVLKKIWPSDDDSRGLVSAAQWAIASGIAVGVARTFAQRAAGKAWEQATGSPPPGESA